MAGRYEGHALVPFADRQVHKLVKFHTTAMVVRGAVESFKPPINADGRGCFHRR